MSPQPNTQPTPAELASHAAHLPPVPSIAPLAVWDKRPNMGASPLAIETAEMVLEDLRTLPVECHGMLVAAMIDGAIRKSAAPDLLAAFESAALAIRDISKQLADLGVEPKVGWAAFRALRAAIAKATQQTTQR